jgi:endonuclease/exonuclease/phosphatase (EEP) superfamily protein YafD
VVSKWATLFGVFIGAFPALFVAMALAGKVALIAELSTHFFVEYFWALLVAMIAFMFLRRWGIVAIFAAFWLVCVFKLLPFYLPQNIPIPPDAPQIKIVNANVNTRNTDFDSIANYVLAMDADVACFEETNMEWVKQLTERLKQKYPYFSCVPRDDNFGIAMFSKTPFLSSKIENYGNVGLPSIIGEFDFAGKRVSVIATHTLPPMEENMLLKRTQGMQGLVEKRKDLGERYIVAGDLNCSSWSPYFDDFANGLGVRDTRLGFGVQPSWPVAVWLLATPIDHILVSDAFLTVERKLGPNVHSDHYPVYARLAIVK